MPRGRLVRLHHGGEVSGGGASLRTLRAVRKLCRPAGVTAHIESGSKHPHIILTLGEAKRSITCAGSPSSEDVSRMHTIRLVTKALAELGGTDA